MFKAHKYIVSLVAILLVCMLNLSACDKLNLDFLGKDDNLEIPSMAPDLENVKLERDAQGLNEADRQYLAYAKDKIIKLEASMNSLGDDINSIADDVFEKAVNILDNKQYAKHSDELMKVIHQIEAVRPDQVPQEFIEAYNRLYFAANRVRHMLFQIYIVNGTNLPGVFDETKAEILPFKESVEQFFADIDSSGLEAAAANIPATDWEAEEARSYDLRNTFNVADYGLKWGSSQWDVMGVEGLQKDGYKAENLAYQNLVYQYTGVRNYHFNQYGQMDSYHYDLDADSFNRGNFDDPVYDDVREISAIVMHAFVMDTYALYQEPINDGAGNYTVSFDPPAERILIQGNNDSLKVVVEAKKLESGADTQ